MRVFVTGATGFIGSAIVRELQEAGHHVTGLARSEEAAAALAKAGAQAHRGSLDDLDSLAAGARASEGVIHTAFVHDFSRYAQAGEADRRAVAAMAEALAGSGRPFVVTSVTAALPPGATGTERDAAVSGSPGGIRARAERAALACAAHGVRASVVRLPPTVHGRGDRAFVPVLIARARETGVSAHVGDGRNRWPAVHRLDAARLYRLALEGAQPGARLHAVAEDGVALRTLAEAIGEELRLPVRGIAAGEAEAHFGWLARFVAIDNPASAALTREALGWHPREPGLLSDLHGGEYFA